MSVTILIRRTKLVALGIFIVLATFVTPVHAADSNGALAQGFTADTGNGDIVTGAIVSFKSNNSHTVELATSGTAERIAGVADRDPLVVISSANTEAQVVLSGSTSVLVSDINGPINADDKITASPIAGVGMVATADSRVVGTALAKFDASNASTQTITDTKGQQRTVHIGYIPLQVAIAFYQAPGSNFLPPFIQSLANSIAGKPVSLIRILLCGFLLLVGFVTVAVLIYSAVRSAMQSLGRNPLAAPDIRKGLYQVAGVSVAILLGTLFANYIVLTF